MTIPRRHTANLRVIEGDESPAADIRIGPGWRMRIFGFSDLTPPLVEVRSGLINGEVLNLTVAQAEEISAGLLKASAKARGS